MNKIDLGRAAKAIAEIGAITRIVPDPITVKARRPPPLTPPDTGTAEADRYP
jgi:hypothetical protein